MTTHRVRVASAGAAGQMLVIARESVNPGALCHTTARVLLRRPT